MRDVTSDLALDGIELTDVHTGMPARPAEPPGVHVVTLIRHRF